MTRARRRVEFPANSVLSTLTVLHIGHRAHTKTNTCRWHTRHYSNIVLCARIHRIFTAILFVLDTLMSRFCSRWRLRKLPRCHVNGQKFPLHLCDTLGKTKCFSTVLWLWFAIHLATFITNQLRIITILARSYRWLANVRSQLVFALIAL